ncbi:DUF6801 domain-containing protein [Kutzneria buriramensis]|uniref:DUF6801 domain-containing protein n=1 Tax=Kutzneria buriramensis TaxID=1045776 RepID=A0A3E0GTY9_9PSEU|nr:DUF6801 domain-containing protein [Kutzneria buriramensis]REH26473.1 hypothetical protein BCF44_13244 [Kutzneria buriramensis]
MALTLSSRLCAVAGVALALGSVPFAAAAAGTPVAKTLAFTCPFPLIGNQTLSVRIQAVMTVPSAVGGDLVTSDFTATATVPPTATQGLALVGAATIAGTAQAGVTLNEAGTPLDITIPGLTIPSTPVPASGSFDTVASGPVPTATITRAGATTVTVGGFSTTLTPKKADGSPTGLGTFTSDCTLNPGQDAQLISFTVGGGGSTTTTTPPPTTTTTTPPTTTTTLPPTTTTDLPTTTTAQPTTTTDLPTTVEPTTLTPGEPSTTDVAILPAANPSPPLAFTGASILLPTGLGFLLIAAGLLLLRRRHPRESRSQTHRM